MGNLSFFCCWLSIDADDVKGHELTPELAHFSLHSVDWFVCAHLNLLLKAIFRCFLIGLLTSVVLCNNVTYIPDWCLFEGWQIQFFMKNSNLHVFALLILVRIWSGIFRGCFTTRIDVSRVQLMSLWAWSSFWLEDSIKRAIVATTNLRNLNFFLDQHGNSLLFGSCLSYNSVRPFVQTLVRVTFDIWSSTQKVNICWLSFEASIPRRHFMDTIVWSTQKFRVFSENLRTKTCGV